jgi:UDP-N-acetyl-D-mannosaminuronic acid dehydrogenase
VTPTDTQPLGGQVAVIGLGYVGLTLAVSLARAGVRVTGVEHDPATRAALAAGRPALFEPGVAELLRDLPPGRLRVTDRLPDEPIAAVVVCVGTPIDPATQRPALQHFDAAVDHLCDHVSDTTLVVVRSTVPVGTTRRIVHRKLAERLASPLLAFCPERTIQGRALEELAALPQVIGGVDEASVSRARQLFAPVAPDQVVVSSIEAAELVKLACNAHTDLIYGFGNQIGLIADALAVDGNEVIAAANLRYPRPDLSRPGFVGGSCLTKDPYLLIHSAGEAGYHPPMVAAARAVNESVPGLVVERTLKALAGQGRAAADAKVLVCGIAYKGRPETDDVRGSAAVAVARALRDTVGLLAGHDYRVPPERINALGYRPTGLAEGLTGADAVVVLTDHPRYRQELTLDAVRSRMTGCAVVFDVWGDLADQLGGQPGVTYRRFGRG